MTAVEPQERLAKITDVERLRPRLDYPTPAAMVDTDRVAPAKLTERPWSLHRHDEPIAIIAASCRFPGSRGPMAYGIFWRTARTL
jgi:hypothetical protein